MNGAHDMGGMEGFGPVQPEPEAEEPVFHHEWESRVFGLTMALGFHRRWNIDMSRHARERQHPVDYLRHSYYENWLAGLEALMLDAGLVTRQELRTGKSKAPVPEAARAHTLRTEQVGSQPLRVTNYRREVDTPPRFKRGDRVRAINRHPSGHTREPRYLRGKVGVVHEHYGGQVYPDLSATGIDEGRHMYSVRFEGPELWGESASPNTVVYADMWEPYLEPAS